MTQPIPTYLFIGLVSFVLTLALVPLCRWLARRLEVVDHPDQDRKVHREPIPYLGGLAFYAAFLVTVLAIQAIWPQYTAPYLYPMAFVGTLIVMMGVYDDVYGMSSFKKLLIELALCVVLYLWGFQVSTIGHPLGGAVEVGWLAIVITPLWIAGVINAINFSDGLDGLAGGLVFICAAAMFAINFHDGHVLACIIMAFLMGTTLAFLHYNFNPASIFMGDAGALFLGFVLGASTLVHHQKGVAVIALAVPMVVLGVPILDTVLSFYRRLQRARSGEFFRPDRHHLHHRLLDLGLSQRQVVLSLYFVSIFLGLMAYTLSVTPPGYSFLILLLAAMAITFGVLVLRYIEGFARDGRLKKQRNSEGDAS